MQIGFLCRGQFSGSKKIRLRPTRKKPEGSENSWAQERTTVINGDGPRVIEKARRLEFAPHRAKTLSLERKKKIAAWKKSIRGEDTQTRATTQKETSKGRGRGLHKNGRTNQYWESANNQGKPREEIHQLDKTGCKVHSDASERKTTSQTS